MSDNTDDIIFPPSPYDPAREASEKLKPGAKFIVEGHTWMKVKRVGDHDPQFVNLTNGELGFHWSQFIGENYSHPFEQSPKPRLKRFIFLAWDTYYPGRGMGNIQGSFDTLDEAKAFAHKPADFEYYGKDSFIETYDHVEIVDQDTSAITIIK